MGCSWLLCIPFYFNFLILGHTVLAPRAFSDSANPILRTEGVLDSRDSTLPDGSYYDEYNIQGQVGQELTITLESSDFDTYLFIGDTARNVIADNDDISQNNTNSSFTVILPVDGEYIVVANAYNASERGQYILTIYGSDTQNYVDSSGQEDSNVAQESPGALQQQCQGAISSAVDTIQDGRNTQVADIATFDLAPRYSNYPTNAPMGVVLRLGGQAAADVLNSHQFMTTLSTQIIEECQQVSLVEFQMNYTDWNVVYGLVNGKVVGFECVKAGVESDAIWGQKYCL